MSKHIRAMLLAVFVIALSMPLRAADYFVYFGTQDKAPGTGFSLARFDADTGSLSTPKLILAADCPSYFAIHPDNHHLYSTNFSRAGGVSSYALDPASGALTLLNRIAGNNAGTSYISLDPSAHAALAANFASGHLAVFPIRPDFTLGAPPSADGEILHSGSSVDPQRQSKTYPHCIITDPGNHFALSTDLGLDKVFIYHFDPQKPSLTAADPPFVAVKPGSGPRHIRFHPNGRWVYLVCEMGSSVIAFQWRDGTLREFQSVSTVPADFAAENNAAELEIHPSGKFLYASNRGHDSIAAFAINPASGELSPIGHYPTQGRTPRNFTFDPTGRWIVATNQDGNSAVVFRIAVDTGRLTQTGDPVKVPAPCGIRFLPMAIP
jgi:6-phosphogluconolactonase